MTAEPWRWRKIFRPPGKRSLACECLRDGTLDVCLTTATVYGMDGKPRRVRADRDGYLGFLLQREVKRGGKVERDGRRKRRRRREYVILHRLVLMKALAVQKHGDAWREHVVDLPRGVDVDHLDRDRQNNAADNLCLSTESANRAKRPMTAEEEARLEECLAEFF